MEHLTEIAEELREERGVVLIEVIGDTIHIEFLDEDPDEP